MIGLVQMATGSLLAAVWQGMLLVVAAGLGLRLLPKTPAAVRFAIWFGVFLLVAALPVIALWPRVAGASGHGAWIVVDERWCVAIAAMWLIASLVRAGSLVAAALRVRALWKRATPVGASYGSRRVSTRELLEAPGPLRRVLLCTSDEVDRPTVIGFFSPKILIPEWLLEKLSEAELEQIVLHERGHLGRADDWMNLLQKIALVMFPLNPALAWVERRLCFERELAVDERVLEATGAPKAYAACLANLAEHRLRRRGLALVLGALGRESELGRRVGRILRRGERMKPLQAKLVLGCAMLGLLVAATGFERCPQVVGFANSGATGTEARQQIIAPGGGVGAGFHVVNVAYKALDVREMQAIVRVTHRVRMGAADSSARQNASAGSAKAVQNTASASRGLHPTLYDEAVKDGVPERLGLARNTARTGAEEATAQAANGMVQWMVVTTWRDGQATRMVFTAERDSNKAPVIEQDSDGPAVEAVPSYAAVPVRGGWLVIQL